VRSAEQPKGDGHLGVDVLYPRDERNAAGSRDDGGADLRTVRDNLRHASLTSTNPYLHTPDEERHRETEEKHRIDW
jgi:hypothetical protein